MAFSKYRPNRVRAACSTNSTNWQIVASDGVGYASYALLVADGKKPFPGDSDQFPTGIPSLLVRSLGSDSVADGSSFLLLTNQIATPTLEDDMVSGQGQTIVLEDQSVRTVWIKKSVGTDIVVLGGSY